MPLFFPRFYYLLLLISLLPIFFLFLFAFYFLLLFFILFLIPLCYWLPFLYFPFYCNQVIVSIFFSLSPLFFHFSFNFFCHYLFICLISLHFFVFYFLLIPLSDFYIHSFFRKTSVCLFNHHFFTFSFNFLSSFVYLRFCRYLLFISLHFFDIYFNIIPLFNIPSFLFLSLFFKFMSLLSSFLYYLFLLFFNFSFYFCCLYFIPLCLSFLYIFISLFVPPSLKKEFCWSVFDSTHNLIRLVVICIWSLQKLWKGMAFDFLFPPCKSSPEGFGPPFCIFMNIFDPSLRNILLRSVKVVVIQGRVETSSSPPTGYCN